MRTIEDLREVYAELAAMSTAVSSPTASSAPRAHPTDRLRESRGRRRLAIAGALVVAAAAAALTTVIGTGEPRHHAAARPTVDSFPPVSLSSTRMAGVGLTHPATWHAYLNPQLGPDPVDQGFLSTDRLRTPCASADTRRRRPVDCGDLDVLRSGQLSRNGVLVTVTNTPYPALVGSLDPNTTIARRPAHVTVRRNTGRCAMDVDATIVTALRAIDIDGCFAGPDPSIAAAQFRQMLRTVHLSG